MKKIIIKALISSIMLFTLLSCDLDQLPSTAIERDDAFKTYEDAERFANGMSAYYRDTQYGVFVTLNEIQTDMFNASITFSNTQGDFHGMGPDLNSGNNHIIGVWEGIYRGISSVNNFLEKIESIKTSDPEQEKNIKKFIGQAHYYRAAYYHALVRFYAKPYNSDSDGQLEAVPIVLKINLTEKPARATLANVYTQINNDIAAARTYLADVPGVVRSIEPTIDVVKALDARVKLYTRKYDEAAVIAGEIIATGVYQLAKTAEQMEEEWYRDNGTESIYQMHSSLTEGRRSNSQGYLVWKAGVQKYTPDYIPTKTCLQMYESEDLRYKEWFAQHDCILDNVDYSLVLFQKYRGNPALETAPSRNYSNKPKVFTISEMYLIKAEALAMSGDVAGAKATLNELQKARKAPLTDGSIVSVQKEWAKEKIGEGFRLDCLKRWNQGYNGRPAQIDNAVMQSPIYTGKICPPGYNLFVWGIPERELIVNPSLSQNSGW